MEIQPFQQQQVQTVERTTTPKPWEWTRVRVRAVKLAAEDELSDEKIAKELGIGHRTVQTWQARPEFQARKKQIRAAWEARIFDLGVANKANRIKMLDGLNRKQERIMQARSEDPDIDVQASGGDTGLIVKEIKRIGKGDEKMEIIEVSYDAAFSREYRATLQQAAEEMGQIVSRRELSGPDGGPIQVSIGVLDDIVSRVRAIRARADYRPNVIAIPAAVAGR